MNNKGLVFDLEVVLLDGVAVLANLGVYRRLEIHVLFLLHPKNLGNRAFEISNSKPILIHLPLNHKNLVSPLGIPYSRNQYLIENDL